MSAAAVVSVEDGFLPGLAVSGADEVAAAGALASIVTRFPAAWLSRFTGDWIRVVTAVQDYGRKRGSCWASDQTVADALALSRGTVNRLLNIAQAQDVVRSEFNARYGTQSRWVRPTGGKELAVCVSAYSRAALSGNRFKVYGALSLRAHLKVGTSAAQLSRLCGITAETARTTASALVAEGWVGREAVSGGAYLYVVHAAPVFGVATQPALFAQPQQRAAQPLVGVDQDVDRVVECAGQLALFTGAEEVVTPLDSVTAAPLDSRTAAPLGSVTQTGSLDQDLVTGGVGGAGCSRVAATSVTPDAGALATGRDRPVRRLMVVPGGPLRGEQRFDLPHQKGRGNKHHLETAGAPVPPQDLASVLAPVAGLWRRLDSGAQARVAMSARTELATVAGWTRNDAAAVLAARLERRLFAQGGADQVKSPVGWLLGRGLVQRPGCGDAGCDEGERLTDGEPCARCGELLAGKRALRRSVALMVDTEMPSAQEAERLAVTEARLREFTELAATEDLARRADAQALRQLQAAAWERDREAVHAEEQARLAAPCLDCGRERSAGLCADCDRERGLRAKRARDAQVQSEACGEDALAVLAQLSAEEIREQREMGLGDRELIRQDLGEFGEVYARRLYGHGPVEQLLRVGGGSTNLVLHGGWGQV